MGESGFTPSGGERPPHVERQGPPEPNRPQAGRPRTVTAASVLWIILGVTLVAGGIGESAATSANFPGGPADAAAVVVVAGIGVIFIVLAARMRRGRQDARTALTVIGSISMIFLWPIVLVVPALILQYRRGNKAWFAANRPPSPGPWAGPTP